MEQLRKELKNEGIILDDNNCLVNNLAEDKQSEISERQNVDNYKKALEKIGHILGYEKNADGTLYDVLMKFSENEIFEIKNAWRFSYNPFAIEVLKPGSEDHNALFNNISSYWEIYSPFHMENETDKFKDRVLEKIDKLNQFEQECLNYHLYNISVENSD